MANKESSRKESFPHPDKVGGNAELKQPEVISSEILPNNEEILLLKDLQVDGLDKRKRKVLEMLWAVKEFKIYKTVQSVSPHFSDDHKLALEQRERYFKLGSQLAHMNHLIHLLPEPLRKKKRDGFQATRNYYEREMARGIAQALSGDVDQGILTLEALAIRLEKRLRNKGRVIYFAMCLCTALILVAALIYFFGENFGFDVSEVALVVVMGSIGALLSTATGLRNINVDASSTLFMSWVYGGQRMLVGVLGAIVLYLMVRAGVALNLIPGATEGIGELNPYKLAFISVLAGFSERLVPNLLDRQSTDESQASQTNAVPEKDV